ncbi:MAG: serine/threonine protein kinase [Myxococcales bacterium]|nr:serine/threonine protein kinase [Myxococcales bacterium]
MQGSPEAKASPEPLKVRQLLGKYRLEQRLAEGGFSTVFKAFDTIEGIHVALKVPHDQHVNKDFLDAVLKEVRLTAKMQHPNILPIKNAGFIGEYFVIAYPLGDQSLGDRMAYRMSTGTALEFAEQLIGGLACAHAERIIHCDIKPDNLILFGDQLKLTDFGIAKIAVRTRTLAGGGAGTLGYIAPEQALGKLSFRSDVFSAGLILYRMFAGTLPAWPFEWPPPGVDRLRKNLHPDFIALIQKAISMNDKKRFADAEQMLRAFQRVKPRALKSARAILRKQARATRSPPGQWKTVRLREFRQRFGATLETKASCQRCAGPMSESMLFCPWCGKKHATYHGPTSFPTKCERCCRGMKHDWKYCAFCYGPGFEPSARSYTDVRYTAKCSKPKCGGPLMPFLRYCPWCRTKVKKKWPIEGNKDKCGSCGWGFLAEFWDYCPWCGKRKAKT